MKEIFARELEKQQQSLLKLIIGNFEITMKEIKNIKSEVNELKKHQIYRGCSEDAEES